MCMAIEDRVRTALEQAWITHQGALSEPSYKQIPIDIIEATDKVLALDSAPYRQFLITIAAGTSEEPASNPASLQLTAGVDRRGQAIRTMKPLSRFIEERGIKLKLSKDPGVSNQWREPEITQEWVAGRQAKQREAAEALLGIVEWLKASINATERQIRAQDLLDRSAFRVIQLAAENALDYPRFRASPRTAMQLIENFLALAPERPDAMEAVVTVASRVLAHALDKNIKVERRDITSPDPIDILITSPDGVLNSGIEVTDTYISLAKLQHEVIDAMLRLGLDRAVVVSRGVLPAEAMEIDSMVTRAYTHFQQRIDLVTIDSIEAWLSFPATPRDLAIDFLWGLGEELDKHSNQGNRRAWWTVLTNYAAALHSGSAGTATTE